MLDVVPPELELDELLEEVVRPLELELEDVDVVPLELEDEELDELVSPLEPLEDEEEEVVSPLDELVLDVVVSVPLDEDVDASPPRPELVDPLEVVLA